MSVSKKPLTLWRHGIFDLCLGILILFYSTILMQNFLYAFLYIFTLTSFSSLNVINISKRVSPLSFSSSLVSLEDEKSNLISSKKLERKDFSLFRCLCILLCTISIYYVFAVLFGAPLIDSYQATMYFSCLMVLLSVYPLLWYYFFTDCMVATLKILLDTKFHTVTESHLHTFAVWTVIGAWFGAFPIPLDWDRPWQEWPITCCVGASLGFAAAHLYMGCKILHMFFKDSRKVSGNRQV